MDNSSEREENTGRRRFLKGVGVVATAVATKVVANILVPPDGSPGLLTPGVKKTATPVEPTGSSATPEPTKENSETPTASK